MKNSSFNHAKPGFVLVSVFIMMAIASLIVVQLCTRGTIYNLFVPALYEREQARFAALSGISCALNQLAMKDSSLLEKEKADEKKEDPTQRKRDYFVNLLLIQNKWQKFEIKQDDYKAEGGFYITCEEGKIPLNNLMDFKTQKFITLQKPALFKAEECLEYVCKKIEEINKGKDAFNSLKKSLKERKYAFTAVEELLSLEEYKSLFSSFYPTFPSDKGDDKSSKQILHLWDLFTVYSKEPFTNPWFFTQSLKIIFEIKDEKKMDSKEYQQIVKSIDFAKTALSQEWDKSLKKIYNKSYTALSDKIVGLLTAKFEPRFFSVLCYARVGKSEQRLCAYIERLWEEKTETLKVQKIYWL